MKSIFKKTSNLNTPFFYIIKKIFLCGVKGSLHQSENRTTLYTNLMALWGMTSITPLIFFLENNNIHAAIYGLPYAALFLSSLFIFKLNNKEKFLQARILGVFLLNAAAWQAAILFGKTFNGYYMFFIALIYSIFALSKAPMIIRSLTFLITFLALPLNDFLSFDGTLPITDLDSKNFSSSLLVIDTLITTGFISIIMFVEKLYSNQYEYELNETNNHLEELVLLRSESLVKEKEKNLQVAIMKSQFLSNMSHELRIPLQGIWGYVELGEKNLIKLKLLHTDEESKKVTSKLDRSFIQINHSLKRLLNLMEKLFKITESGQYLAHPSEFLLQDAILATIESLKSNHIKLNVDEHASLKPYTDITLLQQSLLALLENAIKFSEKGSDIQVNVSSTDTNYTIEVINQGYGILDTEKDLIFQPFFQGTLTDKGIGGTGIGLTLCQKYMNTIGGDVFLKESSPKKTCFTIQFPKFYFRDSKNSMAS